MKNKFSFHAELNAVPDKCAAFSELWKWTEEIVLFKLAGQRKKKAQWVQISLWQQAESCSSMKPAPHMLNS